MSESRCEIEDCWLSHDVGDAGGMADTTEPAALSDYERGVLTMYGEAISAQARDGRLALHVREDAPRTFEDGRPAILPEGDVAKLRELLVEGQARGLL